MAEPGSRDYRSVWISDLHLGTRACRAEPLLAFLAGLRVGHLYLVGDIVDLWCLRRGFYWPKTHNDVARRILELARSGTKVTYVPGNHDELLRAYDGLHLAGITIQRQAVHRTRSGRRLLVFHGDELDFVVREYPWLAHLGDRVYIALLAANRALNALRRLCGLGYWSLAGYLKEKTKNAVKVIGSFEAAVAADVRARGLDGCVCGHIHKAEMRRIDGVLSSTTATGWRAARRWSRPGPASWRSCAGTTTRPCGNGSRSRSPCRSGCRVRRRSKIVAAAAG